IHIDHPRPPHRQLLFHHTQRILASSSRPKPVAAFDELLLEDRFDCVEDARLNHSVDDRRHPQRTLLSIALRDPHSLHCVRLVRLLSKLFTQPRQPLFGSFGKSADRHPIHSSASSPCFDVFPRDRQALLPVHLIDQAVPLPSLHSVFQSLQHALRPYRAFHPVPSARGFSSAF